MRFALLFIAAAALWSQAGATTAAAEPEAAPMAAIQAGDYRLMFLSPIGELPFNVTLEQKGDAWTATLINGPERVKAEKIAVAGDTLTLEFPSYNSSLTGTVGADGAFTGLVTLTTSTGQVRYPITGAYGQTHRFFAEPPTTVNQIGGRWALTLSTADGKVTRTGLLELSQQGSVVDGAAMYTTGDSRFLNGDVRDNTIHLSTFDGGQGGLWAGKLLPDGTLWGLTWSPLTNIVSQWTAVRNATAKLEDATKLTYLKPGYDTFTFAFPNLAGKKISLADKRYKGKVVVVTIGGSWCPTCHDETAFMAPFYKANKDRGLEVIGLMYEYSPDPEVAAAAVRNFAARYGVAYEQLIAGVANKAAASATLPMINAVLVYPTMIVVDRKGNVRKIHTGFPGPATGTHHVEFKRDFTALIDSLLAEDA